MGVNYNHYSPRKTNFSKIDKYLGEKVEAYRILNDFTVKDFAVKLDVSEDEYLDAEAGKIKFRASDLFTLKREFDMPLEGFFSFSGELYSKILSQNSEINDVLHYFSNIKDPKVRAHILFEMKSASAVF